MKGFTMFYTFIVSIFSLLLTCTTASALTPSEIQRNWSKQGNLTGGYVTQYNDNTQDTGTFTFVGSTRLTLSNPSNHSRVTLNANGVMIEDLKFPGNNQSKPDSRLKAVFSSQPSFINYINRKGSSPEVTMLGFSDSDGAMKVYFSNHTGRLEYLVIESDGQKTITRFNYK